MIRKKQSRKSYHVEIATNTMKKLLTRSLWSCGRMLAIRAKGGGSIPVVNMLHFSVNEHIETEKKRN